MWLDDYTTLDRTPAGEYVLSECCLGAAPRGSGQCRCVSHDRYREVRRMGVVEAARVFGTAVVREILHRFARDSAFLSAGR